MPREDLLKIKKVMKNPSLNQAIDRGIQLGIKYKVTSTPTMFISYSGKQQRVEGIVTYLVLKQFIDSIIK